MSKNEESDFVRGLGIAYNETVVKAMSIGADSTSGLKSITGVDNWESLEQVQVDIILDRYKVVKQLGEGSFGRVFLARDEKLNRLVAIKIAKKTFKEQDRLTSFLEEARVLASLDHPYIVPVYDVGNSEAEGVFFISKFIDGISLAGKLTQGPCPLDDAINLISRIADALHHAHEKGLVHRDIKPDNILIDHSGNPHVADFGLALKVDYLNNHSEFNGTPAYMSPEQAGGKGNLVDHRSDIFSLGVVFYELIAGRRLFFGNNLAEIIAKVVKAEIPLPSKLNPNVPMEVERICLKALCKNKSNRYESASDLCSDLQSYLSARHLSYDIKKEQFKYKWIPLVLGSFLLFLCLSVWVIYRSNQADLENKAKSLVSVVFLAEGKLLAQALEKSDECISHTSLIYRKELSGMSNNDPRRMKAILGLGCGDFELDRELCDLMLKANVADFLVIRKRLQPSKEMLVDQILKKIRKSDGDELLRIVGALALWASDNPELDRCLPKVADKLMSQNKLFAVDWAAVFFPIKEKLYPLLLEKICDIETELVSREFATEVCCDLVQDDSVELFNLMVVADPRSARMIFEKMFPLKNEVLAFSKNIRANKNQSSSFEQDFKHQDRQGIAASLQIAFGDDAGFSVFSFSSDATSRSKCQLMLGCLKISPEVIVGKIKTCADISSKSSMVIALGNLDLDSVDVQTRNNWMDGFLEMFRNSPDAGLHGSLDWLLRKRWGLGKECDQIEGSLKSKTINGNKWFVNSIGQTFVIIDGPKKFQMGSPVDEPLRYEAERVHERFIPRSIAVAQKEVTISDFLSLMPEQRYTEKYSKTPDSAMICISWYDCARYCNLLTEKEFGAKECVYLPNEQGLYQEGMRIVNQPLKKKGYRMPTEAEFEFFHRAGSSSMFNHGSDIRLTDRYSFYVANSKDQAWPVGTLRPNEFGLFDTGGNVFEWCLENYDAYPDLNGADEDAFMNTQNTIIMTSISRAMRSGCFYNQISSLRSADRNGAKPDDRSNSRGLRLVRSLP